MMNLDFEKRDVMKALSTVAIQKVLGNIGSPVLDTVSKRLEKEYKCYIPDCYEHPEYLESVLKSVFGNSYISIVSQIKKELIEYRGDKGINVLIQTIER